NPRRRRMPVCPHNHDRPAPTGDTGWCGRVRPAGGQQRRIQDWTSEPLYWTIILLCETQYQKDAILFALAVQSSEQIKTICLRMSALRYIPRSEITIKTSPIHLSRYAFSMNDDQIEQSPVKDRKLVEA